MTGLRPHPLYFLVPVFFCFLFFFMSSEKSLLTSNVDAEIPSGAAGFQQLPGTGEEIRNAHIHDELPKPIDCPFGESMPM